FFCCSASRKGSSAAGGGGGGGASDFPLKRRSKIDRPRASPAPCTAPPKPPDFAPPVQCPRCVSSPCLNCPCKGQTQYCFQPQWAHSACADRGLRVSAM